MAKDKLLHAVLSMILVVVLAKIDVGAAIVITAMAGLIKEACDKLSGKGTSDVADLMADAVGIFIGAMIALAI